MSLQERYPFVHPIEVRFGDLDTLKHVNNAVYLTYFESARIAYALHLRGSTRLEDISFILAEITVTYQQPALFGDQLAVGVRVGRIGSKSFTMEYDLCRGEEVIARGRSVLVWYDYDAEQTMPVPESFREAVRRVQGELPPG